MRILFLTDNFPPEVNAPASRTWEHARCWVAAGHQVTVITGAPNFPQGRVFPGYRNRWFAYERMEGIRVIRVKTFIHANEGFVLRSLDYLSFMVAGFLGGLTVRRADVVVATSPQFFTAIAGWVLGLVTGRPFVFELRDLWPASIAAVGAMGRSRVLRALESVELFLYRRARAIIPVTHTFKAELRARGIDGRKIAVVTNGADLRQYIPRPRDGDLARTLGLDGRFVIGYLGTHGLAHALERVLEAAQLARDDDRLRFLFVGDGAAKATLVARSTELGLANVRFVDSQPKAAMPAYWSLCDLALIHLKDSPVFATVIPSKLFEAMAMGVPVLFAGPAGEASGIVVATGGGVVVPPEDPVALVAAAGHLAGDPAAVAALRAAGLVGARLYERGRLAMRLALVLDLVRGPPRRGCRRESPPKVLPPPTDRIRETS